MELLLLVGVPQPVAVRPVAGRPDDTFRAAEAHCTGERTWRVDVQVPVVALSSARIGRPGGASHCTDAAQVADVLQPDAGQRDAGQSAYWSRHAGDEPRNELLLRCDDFHVGLLLRDLAIAAQQTVVVDFCSSAGDRRQQSAAAHGSLTREDFCLPPLLADARAVWRWPGHDGPGA